MRRKVWYAAFAGAVGTLISNPFDTVLTRIQGDYLLPKEQQRGYSGLGDGMGKILNKEGFKGLMLGVVPNMLRSAAFNIGALAYFD
jgi:hypothetical protein|mmetsp:Transcript_8702/g.1214  ORF Transcript_8702/g.1214 Transcript_8702/m.1214 type:complete len:86 (-) Transcript_8702:335-592(-)|eukprot:CAMPEP_0168314868 /NCGR_PEP_ID=MMETSP0210-20121227/9617_1 /TAXON_ID=40633 /ORGANISM="Condylostoma magnum, Strain COL2" /LENGTH=85 /DNA_ID=CAMNT_0008285347 /DNA_START=334 /DNA_END=594 /DNA_ORIENTATION=-